MTAPSRGFLEAVALVAVIGAAGFYALGQRDAQLQAAERGFVHDADAFRRTAKPFHRQLAARDSEIVAARRVQVVARARTGQLAREAEDLRGQVAALGAAVPAPAQELIANLQRQLEAGGILLAATQRELDATRAQRDSALARLAIADTLLERGRQVAQCRLLLLFPCPSRATAFFVGAGSGIVASLALRR